MSFDLFVIAPVFDRAVAERFNAFERAGFPTGLHIDPEACTANSNFWLILRDGEEWLELSIDPEGTYGGSNRPADMADDWIEVHIPSRGHFDVFHVVAALAELSRGWVADPQCVATMEGYDAGEAQAANAARGFYTPDVTRGIAKHMEETYRWD